MKQLQVLQMLYTKNGMEEFYKKCHSQSVYKNPTNIAKVAEAFGIESRHFDYKMILKNNSSCEIADFVFGKNRPVLIQCEIPRIW